MKKIITVVTVLLIAWFVGSQLISKARSVGVNQGYEPDQPIAYSHKIHAGDNQISCLYCHVGADKGRHAGIPSANICMNCHVKIKTDSPEIKKIKTALEQNKPIEWVKVHRLPDFAYFNHSQHVTSGVNCQECHGEVQTMTRLRQEKPLTMGWCIDCHRAKGIVSPQGHPDIKNKNPQEFMKAIGGVDCAKCHY